MRSTRLAGHGLAFEGGAFYADSTGGPRLKAHYGDSSRVGFGLCECGDRSDELTSNYQRKRWHADHKRAMADPTAVRAARTSDAATEDREGPS